MQILLLLHGAMGAKDQLKPLQTELSAWFEVHSIDFTGHGDENIPEEDFSIQLFAEQVIRYMNEKGLKEVSVFGYSMGGYVAMYIAKNYPGKIHRLITLATKFIWSEEIAAKETRLLDSQKIEEKVPAFAEELKSRHGAGQWKLLLQKTSQLLTALGKNSLLAEADYLLINIPVLLLSGDKDKMVLPGETLSVYQLLPDAQLGILPGTAHPVEQVNTQYLAFVIRQFLN